MKAGAGAGDGAPAFRFVQFEFPFLLGPAPGRYVMRETGDEDALRVLVVATLGAPERRRLLGRRSRARRVDPQPEPTPVPTSRATLVRGHAVNLGGAEAWLARPAERVNPELAVLNRVLHLHRVAAADPAVRPVALAQAVAVRVGHGTGEQVADGRWTEAVDVDPAGGSGRRGERREAMLQPQQRLAALLGGRDDALVAEELVIEARASLDAGRARSAALGLRVALEVGLAELEADRARDDLPERLDELRGERAAVGDAANAAVSGELDPAGTEAVGRVLGRLEAALRARVPY